MISVAIVPMMMVKTDRALTLCQHRYLVYNILPLNPPNHQQQPLPSPLYRQESKAWGSRGPCPRSHSLGTALSTGVYSRCLGSHGPLASLPRLQWESPHPTYSHIPASDPLPSGPAMRTSSDSLSETSRAGLSSKRSSSSDSTGLGYGVYAGGPRVCGRSGSPMFRGALLSLPRLPLPGSSPPRLQPASWPQFRPPWHGQGTPGPPP